MCIILTSLSQLTTIKTLLWILLLLLQNLINNEDLSRLYSYLEKYKTKSSLIKYFVK